jgi:hypothetical protein
MLQPPLGFSYARRFERTDMLIADSTARAFDTIAARQRDLLNIFPAQNEAQVSDSVQFEAPPDTYFVTHDDKGNRSFVRPAALQFNRGTLTDADGREILGYTAAGSALSPLRADSVDSAVGWTGDVRIGSDGVVGYERTSIDPVTGDRRAQYITVGRIAVARFPAGTKLSPADGFLTMPPAGVSPHLGVPGDGSFALLGKPTAKSIDRDLDTGLQRLQEAYLSLDALRAAGVSQGSVEKTAMDLLK